MGLNIFVLFGPKFQSNWQRKEHAYCHTRQKQETVCHLPWKTLHVVMTIISILTPLSLIFTSLSPFPNTVLYILTVILCKYICYYWLMLLFLCILKVLEECLHLLICWPLFLCPPFSSSGRERICWTVTLNSLCPEPTDILKPALCLGRSRDT